VAVYIGSLLVSVCCTALPDDGVTLTPKHVGAVLI